MTEAVEHERSSQSLLHPIEGTRIWGGPISLRFLDGTDPLEAQAYADLLAASGLQSDGAPLSGTWKAEVLDAFSAYKLVANVGFSEVPSATGADYVVGTLSTSGIGGVWGLPGLHPFGAFNNQASSGLSDEPEPGGGGQRRYTFLHEAGHAFGLGHPHGTENGTTSTGAPASSQPGPYISTATVMSYDVDIDGLSLRTSFGLPVTPMALDIAAIQRMYGANTHAHSGDTSYALLDRAAGELDLSGEDGAIAIGRAYYCIWDTNGGDTIQYSGSSRVLINLNQATLSTQTPEALATLFPELQSSQAWTSLSSDTRLEIQSAELSSGGFFSSLLDGSGDRIAGGFTIAANVVIERAKGGDGDDILIGNERANRVEGGVGNDALFGHAGDDVLIGGAGDDEIFTGRGLDYAYGDAGNDTIWDSDPGGGYVYGGTGEDVLTYELSERSVVIDPARRPLGGEDIRDVEEVRGTKFSDDITLSEAIRILGGEGADRITITAPGSFEGGRGNDWIDGSGLTSGLADATYRPGDGRDVLEWTWVYEQSEKHHTRTGVGSLTFEGYSSSQSKILFAGSLISSTTILPGEGDVTGTWATFEGGAAIVLNDGGSVHVGGLIATRYTAWESSEENWSYEAGATIQFDFAGSSHVGMAGLIGAVDVELVSDLSAYQTAPSDYHFVSGSPDGNEGQSGSSGSDHLIGGEQNDHLNGRDGDDLLIGNAGSDTMIGGLGTDELRGGSGGDRYQYSDGDGVDLIVEGATHGEDRLVLGEGLEASAAVVTRLAADPDDVILTFAGRQGAITLDEQLATGSGIELIQFGNGELWGRADILAAVAAGAGDGDQVITGVASVADLLHGGPGDDRLVGLSGSDTYVYGQGEGHDTIVETSSGDYDRLVLGGDLTSSLVDLVRPDADRDDLVLQFSGIDGSVLLDEQFSSMPFYGVEEIQFADGVVWTRDAIFANYVDQAATSANDNVYGRASHDDVLYGRAGRDVLTGYSGADEYRFGLDDGHDTIADLAHNTINVDRVVLGDGITIDDLSITRGGAGKGPDDVTISFLGGAASLTLKEQFQGPYGLGVEEVRFSGGLVWTKDDLFNAYVAKAATPFTDTIKGRAGTADTLYGGGGDDRLLGATGSDTYLAGAPNQVDTIVETYGTIDIDQLILGDGLTPANVVVTRGGVGFGVDDLVLVFPDHNASVVVEKQFEGPYGLGVELIVFAGGVSWTKDDVFDAYVDGAATNSDDIIRGRSHVADVLYGREGSDRLIGGTGSDTYKFGVGDGNDTIVDLYGSSDRDAISFGVGISSSDVALTRSGNNNEHLVVTVLGDGGSVLIDQQYSSSYGHGVEEFRFADGEVWSAEQIFLAYLDQAQSGGDDVIYGRGDISDSLSGGTGDDRLGGLSGSDDYLYNRGDGHDVIVEGFHPRDIDRLHLGEGLSPGSTTVSRFLFNATLHFDGGGSITLNSQFWSSGAHGVEEVVFADGTVWTRESFQEITLYRGTDQDDDIQGSGTIEGGGGNDTVRGGTGSDTICGGSGNDTLHGGAGPDLLTGGEGMDVFAFQSDYALPLVGSPDIILDFVPGQDLIDLRMVDANFDWNVWGSFIWLGNGAFTGVAGQLRYQATGENERTLFGDLNGDAVPDMEIKLIGSFEVAQADLLLT